MTTETKPASLAWLASLCDPGSGKEITQRPHALAWRGEPWTAATDGRILVALRGPSTTEVPSPATLEKLLPLLDAVPFPVVTPLDWPAFRAWVGQRPALVPCDDCGGDGRCDCPRCDTDHECGYCDGSGKREPGSDPALIRGQTFDRHRLARVLPHLPDNPAVTAEVVQLGTPANAPALVVDGQDFRLMLMPMTPPEAGRELPAFQEPTP